MVWLWFLAISFIVAGGYLVGWSLKEGNKPRRERNEVKGMFLWLSGIFSTLAGLVVITVMFLRTCPTC